MATDRLTQLQEAVNTQAENFCNSIGIIQQSAGGSSFPEFERSSASPPDSSVTNGGVGGGGGSGGGNKENVQVHNGNSKVTPRGVKTEGGSTTTTPGGGSGPSPGTGTGTGTGSTGITEDFGQVFARTIAKTAKEIDLLIDSLPPTSETATEMMNTFLPPPGATTTTTGSGGNGGAELYVSSIRRLEQENVDMARSLEETIVKGELMLARIQQALAEIADAQLKAPTLS